VRYNGTNFILQGEVATGDAQASDLLSGKTATTDAGQVIGTMQNRGAFNVTPTNHDILIPIGFHNGGGKVYGDANLLASYILKGKSIFGVIGNLVVGSASGTVTSNSVKKSFYRTDNSQLESNYYVTVSTQLDFVPDVIIVSKTDVSAEIGNILTLYFSQPITSFVNNGFVFLTGDGFYTKAYTNGSNFHAYTDGFTLPVAGANTTYNWYAFKLN
jgi:hypothetical protein